MRLITSNVFGQPSFRMFPTRTVSPYVECFWDPKDKLLVVMLTHKKTVHHYVPKLDDNGFPIPIKGSDTPKMQRITMDVFHEIHISEKTEIISFINAYADNSSIFDYAKYLNEGV